MLSVTILLLKRRPDLSDFIPSTEDSQNLLFCLNALPHVNKKRNVYLRVSLLNCKNFFINDVCIFHMCFFNENHYWQDSKVKYENKLTPQDITV